VQQTLGHLLRQVFTRVTTEALRGGPQSREFVVLNALADQDAWSQQDLAHRLGINRTIMVKLLDQLQSAGYVTRTRNPANRRTYVLSLTGEGRKALTDLRDAVESRDEQITAPLTEPERARLIELVTRLLPEPDPDAAYSTEHLITQAHYRLRRLGDHLLADSGLRTRHVMILPTLDRLAPCPQQRLARELNLTEPATASLVDELVQAGFVVRGQDPHDRRRYALELTDAGRARIPETQAAMAQVETEVRGLLGEDGMRDLRTLLTKLLEGTEPTE
jgi:DNA-binding MarR family transcriptional regulator